MAKVSNHGQQRSQEVHLRNQQRYQEKHGHEKPGNGPKIHQEQAAVQQPEKPVVQPVVQQVQPQQIQEAPKPQVNNIVDANNQLEVALGDQFVPGITHFTETGHTA